MESGSGLGSAAEEEDRNTPPGQDDVYSSESDIILLTRVGAFVFRCPSFSPTSCGYVHDMLCVSLSSTYSLSTLFYCRQLQFNMVIGVLGKS